jgi:hypothetical protein
MTGIVPALETHHHGCAVSQDIDYLTLTLVTPLGAQNHYTFAHARSPPGDIRRFISTFVCTCLDLP